MFCQGIVLYQIALQVYGKRKIIRNFALKT